jgi:hypothetical protein
MAVDVFFSSLVDTAPALPERFRVPGPRVHFSNTHAARASLNRNRGARVVVGGWGGGGWALVGLGPLGEFKKRNSIGWQLESPGLPFLPRAASATGSALLQTHPKLHRLAAAHASKRGLFAAPSGEHSATRTGSPRWPRNKKKKNNNKKK